MKVLALPGFLGTPADMRAVLDGLSSASLSATSDVWSVSQDPVRGPCGSWEEWTSRAVANLRMWKQQSPVLGIGYSLGGRLLLSLAHADPGIFDALVFLSVNPGLHDAQAKEQRLQSDEVWAKRFEAEPWESLMASWNSQGVFQGGEREPTRLEKDFSRVQLAQVLREFSLGRQPDWRDQTLGLTTPQLWLAGEKDPKFVDFIEDLRARVPEKQKGTIQFGIVPSSSHRLLVEQPGEVVQRITEWGQRVLVRPQDPSVGSAEESGTRSSPGSTR